MTFVFENYQYDIEDPGICPHCHNGNEPNFLFQRSSKGLGTTKISYSVWQCTWRDCKRIFVSVNNLDGQGRSTFRGFLDGTPKGPYWPETITKLESRFIKTYLQALQAEHSGLDEIAGMGYRKSLEYLVKDYLIKRNGELKGKIEDQLLAKVISDNFVSDQEKDLKGLLQRATWLGNDMTHYLRYHDNFDINDLKELIKLVMDEMHSIEQKQYYIENIQSKYKKDD